MLYFLIQLVQLYFSGLFNIGMIILMLIGFFFFLLGEKIKSKDRNLSLLRFIELLHILNIHRYYGRKMLFLMMCHPNFDKMLEKYVPSKDLPYIKESVKSLRQKVCTRNLFYNTTLKAMFIC